jgi:predicted transposase YbfD/YdcC
MLSLLLLLLIDSMRCADEPALDAALQNTERLEDLVGILKDLLAKERLRVREASDEICKWKKIANDLQRELDDLKLGLELNPPS